ncbi:MAG: hypothetical protein JSW51_03240 [Gemmatimonadota bacterium]|nr:MAG: hypothetical protein JSW51_03240 [Gemmatimonadota bacterium]
MRKIVVLAAAMFVALTPTASFAGGLDGPTEVEHVSWTVQYPEVELAAYCGVDVFATFQLNMRNMYIDGEDYVQRTGTAVWTYESEHGTFVDRAVWHETFETTFDDDGNTIVINTEQALLANLHYRGQNAVYAVEFVLTFDDEGNLLDVNWTRESPQDQWDVDFYPIWGGYWPVDIFCSALT